VLGIAVPVVGFEVYYLFGRPKPPAAPDRKTSSSTAAPTERRPRPRPPAQEEGDPPYRSTIFDRAGGGGGGSTGVTVRSSVERIQSDLQEAQKSRKTFAVWLFDQSKSTENARADVIAELVMMSRTLSASGGSKPADEQPHLTALGAFGAKLEFLVEEPTADADALQSAADRMASDGSGIENTFAAARQAVEKYLPYRTDKDRHLVLILATDEAGNDQPQADDVLSLCKRYAIPVYVVGSSCLFGKKEGVPADVEGAGKFIVGPESIYPEVIQLAFADDGMSGWDDGSSTWAGDPNQIDSGFGPCTLVRLARESGGAYFAIPRVESGNFSWDAGERSKDPFAWHGRYSPDYVSEQEYVRRLEANKAKKALSEASRLPPADPRFNRTMEFSSGGDEAALKRLLDDAQRPAARVLPPLIKLYDVLKAGDADRDKLTEPRWQAGFDLALGRAAAARARVEAYIAMLAVLKQGKRFERESSSTWVVEPADEIQVGSQLDKMRLLAKERLERVVKDHPDTPWAAQAARELKSPVGWRFVER
jgi:hypothetical protein